MPLIREYASAANPAPGSWVMVIALIFDFSSHAKVGSAKSPGTPKLCRTPRRWRYSKRNCPSGIDGGMAFVAAAADRFLVVVLIVVAAAIRLLQRVGLPVLPGLCYIS